MMLRILYQDADLVAVDKPSGFFVHPPEDPTLRVSPKSVCMNVLRDQLGQYVYPIHRIDRATSGVVLFGLNAEIAGGLGRLFQTRDIRKTYYCVSRGWTPLAGEIDRALKSESSEPLPSQTRFERLAQVELPWAHHKYTTARYSLCRAEPLTGRRHQIRRHFAGMSHPLVGDTVYGDGVHNRLFRENLGVTGLLLKAHAIEFAHPRDGRLLKIESRWSGGWHRIFDLFGVCPYTSR